MIIMSADNWTTCPQCKSNYDKRQNELTVLIGTQYGVIPAGDYQKLLDEFKQPMGDDMTLREDYEVGIYDNSFFMSYSGYCIECKFSFDYKHENSNLAK